MSVDINVHHAGPSSATAKRRQNTVWVAIRWPAPHGDITVFMDGSDPDEMEERATALAAAWNLARFSVPDENEVDVDSLDITDLY